MGVAAGPSHHGGIGQVHIAVPDHREPTPSQGCYPVVLILWEHLYQTTLVYTVGVVGRKTPLSTQTLKLTGAHRAPFSP